CIISEHGLETRATCGMPGRTANELLDLLCAGGDDRRPAPPIVVVAAHPDDEVIGVGSLLPRLSNATFIHVTDGAPRDGRDAAARGFASVGNYATARRQELLAALNLARVAPHQTHELRCSDQQASVCLPTLTRQL